MTDSTRRQLWSLLEQSFLGILQALHGTLPHAKMACGHHRNDAFPFWAYAEFSSGRRMVVVSFSVREDANRLKLWGDIAREDGLILKDIVQTSVNDASDEQPRLVDVAREFASRCNAEIALIRQELT